MTREEAIKQLKGMVVGAEWLSAYMVEALDMAITALEQEPSGDLISRQAVIYYIKGHIHEIITESGEDKNAHTNRVLRALMNGVETMPSVNPQEPKTGHWISHYDEDAKEGWYECDRCHTERAFNTDYCPDCGAKMVEPAEGSEKE